MMKCNLIALAGLVCLSLVSASCSGGKDVKASEERLDQGRIREVNLESRTVVVRHRVASESSNEIVRLYRTYQLAPDCRISTFDKPDAGLEDLVLDEKVDVRYVQLGQDFILYRIKPD